MRHCILALYIVTFRRRNGQATPDNCSTLLLQAIQFCCYCKLYNSKAAVGHCRKYYTSSSPSSQLSLFEHPQTYMHRIFIAYKAQQHRNQKIIGIINEFYWNLFYEAIKKKIPLGPSYCVTCSERPFAYLLKTARFYIVQRRLYVRVAKLWSKYRFSNFECS